MQNNYTRIQKYHIQSIVCYMYMYIRGEKNAGAQLNWLLLLLMANWSKRVLTSLILHAYNKYFYIEITLIKYLLQARIYKCCLFIIIITNRRQLTLRTAYTQSTIYLYTRKGEFFFTILIRLCGKYIFYTSLCLCATFSTIYI